MKKYIAIGIAALLSIGVLVALADSHLPSTDERLANIEGTLGIVYPTHTPVEEPTATPEPTATSTPVPPTATPTETPDLTGQTCPDWVHDQYVTTGPDGGTYATWHPQIDPVYGCYFHHEHGSDPSLFGDGTWEPAFGYAAVAGFEMDEPHVGFKVHVTNKPVAECEIVGGVDPLDCTPQAGETIDIAYVIHMGTSGKGRVCVRYHSVNFVMADGETDELLADVTLMGDFGEMKVNRTETKIPIESCEGIANLRGYDVDEDGLISFGGFGERQIGSYAADNIGYEPWTLDTGPARDATGWHDGDIDVNAHSALTSCLDLTCNEVVPSGGLVDGEYVYDMDLRHGALRSWTWRADARQRLGILDPGNGAEFCTDGYGEVVVDCAAAGAVHQFVAPGTNAFVADGGRHYPIDYDQGWFYSDTVPDLPFGRNLLNHDGQLQAPN